MKVQNKKCIFNLSIKNMKLARVRNIVAIIAIVLTTLLFTSLFTILGSIVKGFEYSNFRQVGTYAHGEYKNITKEQVEILSDDKRIDNYGIRRVLGFGSDERLIKNYTEISCMDENTVEWSFITPATGRLPKENTNEAAADTKVLECLGVPLEIGAEFSVTIEVDGVETTEEFVLCGWWERDVVSMASNIIVPESRLEQTFDKLNTQFIDENIGSYMMTIMLKSSRNIESTLNSIVEEKGYSLNSDDDNYIKVGSNWGYTGEADGETNLGTSLTVFTLLLLIALVGYLIIYNIFRISVSNDIRHYGMLKTIGTTGSQIRSIILTQAIILSVFGISIGLILGWLTGALLTPMVMSGTNADRTAGVSASPIIFILSAFFSFATVVLSCLKPGKIAASVSPIEALRYTETTPGKFTRKSGKAISISRMAAANLAGSKGKTAVTVISLSLSVVLFTLTITFAGSFSIDKYLKDEIFDYQVSCAEYFNIQAEWNYNNALTYDYVAPIEELDGITGMGVTCGIDFYSHPSALLPKDVVRKNMKSYNDDEKTIDEFLSRNQNADGLVSYSSQIQGMDEFILTQMTVTEGDISKLLSDENYVAVDSESGLNVGDTAIIVFTENTQITMRNGEVYTDWSYIDDSMFGMIENIDYDEIEVEFIVAAKINLYNSIGYRYYTGERFIVSNDKLLEFYPNAAPLSYVFNAEDEKEADIEKFIENYTKNGNMDYSSKATLAAEFESFKNTFFILGGALSLIVGLVGVLNFINSILTGIISRKKEFATLQAIGMTGKQLKAMLIYEGIMYMIGAAITAVVFNFLTIPISSVMEKIFWFCDYRFTILPIAITIPIFAAIGVIVPIITYMIFTKKSVIERLRENE